MLYCYESIRSVHFLLVHLLQQIFANALNASMGDSEGIYLLAHLLAFYNLLANFRLLNQRWIAALMSSHLLKVSFTSISLLISFQISQKPYWTEIINTVKKYHLFFKKRINHIENRNVTVCESEKLWQSNKMSWWWR